MFGSRRRLRLRLALEFMAVAAGVNALLLLLLVLVREDHSRSKFDRALTERARMVAREAARESQVASRISLEAVDEWFGSVLTGYEVHAANGALLAETPLLHGVTLDGVRGPARPSRAVFRTIAGERFGKPGGEFRIASVTVPAAPGNENMVVHAVSPLHQVQSAIGALRWLLLLFVLPGTTLAAGLAGWMISERLFRRIMQVTRAAHEMQPGDPTRRLPVPAACDEIGEMVREMNAMIERLDAAFRAQRKFILDVTHELKTPVSVLLAESQVLARSTPAQEPQRYAEFVGSVEEETRRLGQLLESFLTLARASHGRTYVAETLVSVNEVVVQAAARWAPVGRLLGTRISMTLDEGDEQGQELTVRGDQELLTTMLENLLGAISEQVGPKRILEVVVARDGESAGIEVRAIDPERQRLAQPRLVNHRGHELRMAIAQGVAQLHCGSLDSEGAWAHVRLPAVRTEVAVGA